MAQEEVEEGHTIHAFAHFTTTSYTSPPGRQEGCCVACSDTPFLIDFYYFDNSDNDQRITSLTLQAGDGANEGSYEGNNVGFSHTWFYRYYNGYAFTTDWIPYSGTGDIDVPWSGKTGVGQLTGYEPRVVVLVRFHITGDLGDRFYYRVHFTSYKYGTGKPGNAGNHYFWYEICRPPYEVPEFQLQLPVITMLGTVAAYVVRRRKLAKC
ncbi:MAG: hypothetical protein QW222_02195 [Candidatus Bathyarchaeia archaeon]